MGSSLQKLGNTLAGRMQQTANAAVPTTLELGKINANLSLTTDSLQTSIPKGDYMVALPLSSGSYRTSRTTDADSAEIPDHSHSLPGVFRGLRSGDRVLVAWCGNEPIIISVVVGS